MQLPGQLDNTTLGDVLGALHRERATGVLKLVEPNGVSHEIQLKEGGVEQVRTGSRTPRLGDVLRQLGMLAPQAGSEVERLCFTQRTELSEMTEPIGAALVERCVLTEAELKLALKSQTQHRLERVYSVNQARLSFHIAGVNSGVRPNPLGKEDFLKGRPRARDTRADQERQQRSRRPAARRFHVQDRNLAPRSREEALRILELKEDASEQEIRAAFRRLAAGAHPDQVLTPATREAEQQQVAARFARLSAAYHLLVA